MKGKRILGMLAAILLLATLMGCASEESVIGGDGSNLPKGYGDYPLTEGMYRYWMKSWKEYYLKN